MSGPKTEALVQQFLKSSETQQRDLLEALQEKEHYLRVLNSFAVSLIEIEKLDDLYWYVAKEVVGRLGFVDCVIYEYEPETDALVQRAAMGEKSPEGRLLLNPLVIPIGKGVTGKTAASRQPMLIKDLAEFGDYVEDLSPARSELCVPLVHGNELLGVIDCEDPRVGHFSEKHQDMLVMVASMTSSKILECRTRRKLAEQAQIIRQVREAIVVTDLNGKITDCNGGAVALYEFDRDEMVGRHVTDLLEDPDIWDEALKDRARTLDRKGLWRGHERIRTGTGKVLTVDISLTPITDDYGNRIATIGVGRDVTALEEARAALTSKNKALEKALAEREAARSESRAKDAFLANTSHELRTPLTGLIGMIDLLAETRLTAEQREIIAAASTSAQGLSAIIDDILDLAKIEAGKLDLRKRPFDPVELVRNTYRTMVPAADAKGLQLLTHWPETAPFWLEGDANRIRQVLFNLLGNAVKFTEKGEVSLACDLTPVGDECLLKLTVTDTGPGFTEAEKSRIFKRFHQLDASAQKHAAGAGLGLAISQELAAMMGGEIQATSEPGKGSQFCFSVTLPSCAAPESQSRNLRQVPKVGLEGLRVLIVEDHPINQALATKLVERAGARVTVANNGREALDRLDASPDFDLILMDIRMPVMDGETAARKIREMAPDVASIPIVALTANAQASDRRRYMTAGMNAVVAKPIDSEELVSTVRAVMQSAR